MSQSLKQVPKNSNLKDMRWKEYVTAKQKEVKCLICKEPASSYFCWDCRNECVEQRKKRLKAKREKVK